MWCNFYPKSCRGCFVKKNLKPSPSLRIYEYAQMFSICHVSSSVLTLYSIYHITTADSKLAATPQSPAGPSGILNNKLSPSSRLVRKHILHVRQTLSKYKSKTDFWVHCGVYLPLLSWCQTVQEAAPPLGGGITLKVQTVLTPPKMHEAQHFLFCCF